MHAHSLHEQHVSKGNWLLLSFQVTWTIRDEITSLAQIYIYIYIYTYIYMEIQRSTDTYDPMHICCGMFLVSCLDSGSPRHRGDQVWVKITKSHLIFWPSSLYPPSQVQWGLLMLKSQLFHGEIRFDANNTRCLIEAIWIYVFDGRRNGHFHWFCPFFVPKDAVDPFATSPLKQDPLEHVIVINLQDERGGPCPFHDPGFKRSNRQANPNGTALPRSWKRLAAPWSRFTIRWSIFGRLLGLSFQHLETYHQCRRDPWFFSKKPLFWSFLVTFRALK